MSRQTAEPQIEVESAPAGRHLTSRLGWVGWVSVAVIAIAVLLAIFGPMLAPFDPESSDLSYANVGPYGAHLLGFDGQGRDVLSRLLTGARTTIVGAAFVAVVSIIVGSTVAIVTAWFGGKIDTGVSIGVDVLFVFPGILLAVLAAALFGPSLLSAALAMAIAYSPYVARVLRSAALRERAMTYIAALEVQGFGALRLCARHLLPNISSLIVAQGTVLFGFAMIDLAAISFLGLGVQTPAADWGLMISEGKTSMLQGYPLVSICAVLCIVSVVAAVTFLGDRLDRAAKDSNR